MIKDNLVMTLLNRKLILVGLTLSALAGCTTLTEENSVNQAPRNNTTIMPPVVENLPIGSAYVRVSDQYKRVSSVPKESVAITIYEPHQNRWYAVGPLKMVSTGQFYESGVLTQACGEETQTQFLVSYGHYRIHRCIGRTLKSYDIDVAKMYNLPLYY